MAAFFLFHIQEVSDLYLNERVELMSFFCLLYPPVGIYPVDILEDDPAGHQEATLAYYAMLGEGARPSPEVFSLPTGEQVCVIFSLVESSV